MKNIVLAAALALIAVPALAVGPESFTVDINRGYQASPAGQEQATRSNWAPRGQQQAQQASEDCQGAECQPQSQRPRATKASGKTQRAQRNRAPKAPQGQPGAAPANAPAPEAAPAGHN